MSFTPPPLEQANFQVGWRRGSPVPSGEVQSLPAPGDLHSGRDLLKLLQEARPLPLGRGRSGSHLTGVHSPLPPARPKLPEASTVWPAQLEVSAEMPPQNQSAGQAGETAGVSRAHRTPLTLCLSVPLCSHCPASPWMPPMTGAQHHTWRRVPALVIPSRCGL